MYGTSNLIATNSMVMSSSGEGLYKLTNPRWVSGVINEDVFFTSTVLYIRLDSNSKLVKEESTSTEQRFKVFDDAGRRTYGKRFAIGK
jgi:hypothetical protein